METIHLHKDVVVTAAVLVVAHCFVIILLSQLGNVTSEYRHIDLQMKHTSLLLNYRLPLREKNLFSCPQHCAALSGGIITKRKAILEQLFFSKLF